jgi:ATP-dependent protease ClpP protease subunit
MTADQGAGMVQQILELGAASVDPLLIHVHAGGANFDAAMAVHDALQICSAPTIGLATGQIRNSGCFVLQGCGTRLMSRFASVVFSEYDDVVFVPTAGTESASALFETHVHHKLEGVRSLRLQAIQVIAERSKANAEKVGNWLYQNLVFDAEQALEAGLVDAIV